MLKINSVNKMNNFSGKHKSHYFSYSNGSFTKLLMRLITFFASEDICCRNEDGREESFGYNVQYPNTETRLNYQQGKTFSNNQCQDKLWLLLFLDAEIMLNNFCTLFL